MRPGTAAIALGLKSAVQRFGPLTTRGWSHAEWHQAVGRATGLL